MTKDLKLSENHGLNPSMDICYWCGKSKAIILAGLLPDDIEAPREVITSYDPCDECSEKFGQGVHVIEVTPIGKDGQPPMQNVNDQPVYPTGQSFVISKDSDFILGNKIDSPVVLIDTELMENFINNN